MGEQRWNAPPPLKAAVYVHVHVGQAGCFARRAGVDHGWGKGRAPVYRKQTLKLIHATLRIDIADIALNVYMQLTAYHKWKKALGLGASERVMEDDVRRYSIDCNLGRRPFVKEKGGVEEREEKKRGEEKRTEF